MIALVAVVAVLSLFAVCVVLTLGPWLTLRRKSVVVVLDDERTIAGVLWRKSGPLLFIRSAEIATDQGPVPADGVIVVERARVLWIQAGT